MMYADTDLLFPYFHNFSQEFQQLDQFCHSQKSDASMDSAILEYDMGGEGDLFKAPEPVIEESVGSLEPLISTISMISCGNDIISTEAIRVADIESTNEQLLTEVFYDCKKDLLAKSAIEAPPCDIFDIRIPVEKTDGVNQMEEALRSEASLQKSVSTDCLNSMEWANGSVMRPNFLDFPGIDFGAVYRMRRAFSEGDIKGGAESLILSPLGNDNTSLVQSTLEQPLVMSSCTSAERLQKLNRYRNKKTKRNFGRKIKYACRKALADTQPRIRGRFAKTDELEIPKKQ